MIRFELKKVFSRKGNKIAVLFLVAVLGIVCYFAIGGVDYVNENGDTEKGLSAIQKLKEVKAEWAGELTEEKVAKVIEENVFISQSEESRSNDIQLNNIAYGYKQGFSDIRNLLAYSYGKFREYDYYRPDTLRPEEAGAFYSNRILHLQEWLDTEGEGAEKFSKEEKAFLIQQYEKLETPMYYEYAEGWKQFLELAPSLIMIMVLVLGFLTANIFSGEFQMKADAIFFSAYHGRGKAITAKVKAGFILITIIYWFIMLLFSGIVLGMLGFEGAECVIQTGMGGWKSFYNITHWQEYLLVLIGGYIGSLFILFLTMLVSAKTKSTVLAVMVPFILIFIPSFLSGSSNSLVESAIGLLPDQLLQMNMVVKYFNLYNVGGRIVGAAGILLTLYTIFTVLLYPILYSAYRKIEVK